MSRADEGPIPDPDGRGPAPTQVGASTPSASKSPRGGACCSSLQLVTGTVGGWVNGMVNDNNNGVSGC